MKASLVIGYLTFLLIQSLFAQNTTTGSCNSPLLQRAEIRARFGGDQNILQTPQIAGSGLQICSDLQGKPSCVSDAGIQNFYAWVSQYKSDFLARGAAAKSATLQNATSALASINPSACVNQSIVYTMWLAYSASISQSSTGSIDYTSFAAGLSTSLSQIQQNQDYQAAVTKIQTTINNWLDAQKQLVAAKSSCATQVFMHLITVTCLAANASAGDLVSGTSSSPTLKYSTQACSNMKKNCLSYVSSAKRTGDGADVVGQCSNPNTIQVNQLLNSFSASSNDALNKLWQSVNQLVKQNTQGNLKQQPEQQNAGAGSATATATRAINDNNGNKPPQNQTAPAQPTISGSTSQQIVVPIPGDKNKNVPVGVNPPPPKSSSNGTVSSNPGSPSSSPPSSGNGGSSSTPGSGPGNSGTPKPPNSGTGSGNVGSGPATTGNQTKPPNSGSSPPSPGGSTGNGPVQTQPAPASGPPPQNGSANSGATSTIGRPGGLRNLQNNTGQNSSGNNSRPPPPPPGSNSTSQTQGGNANRPAAPSPPPKPTISPPNPGPPPPFQSPDCDIDNTGASDCDIICYGVLNATGIKENVFFSLNTGTATSNRLLLTSDPSLELVSSGACFDPQSFGAREQSNAAVGQEPVLNGGAYLSIGVLLLALVTIVFA